MYDPQNEKDCRTCGEPTTGRYYCEECEDSHGDEKYDWQKENGDD